MALDSNIIEKLNEWASVIDSVGDDVARYAVYVACRTPDLDVGLAEKYLDIMTNSAEVDELHAKVRKRYVDKTSSIIDPVTTFDILNGVMWPAISSDDAAMVDHPDNPNINSMRQIPYTWVFNDSGGLQVGIDGTARKLIPNYDGEGNINNALLSDLRDLNPVKRAYKALLAALQALEARNVKSKADNKQALSLLFKSEQAAKLYWLYFGRHSQLAYPINVLRSYNTYLGFFLWTVGWNGGTNAVETHNIKVEIEKFLPGFWIFSSTGTLGAALLDTDTIVATKAIAQAVNATNAGLIAQYTWLQKQKTNDNKDYYDDWFKRFFNKPKSLVNMVVIINEIINIDSKKQFTHTLTTKERLAKLAVGYQSAFKITIGA